MNNPHKLNKRKRSRINKKAPPNRRCFLMPVIFFSKVEEKKKQKRKGKEKPKKVSQKTPIVRNIEGLEKTTNAI